jgi:small redox-active disulfide protein 2
MFSTSSTNKRLKEDMEIRIKVQVLGTGCSKCKTLEERVRQLIAQHQLNIDVEKVSDLQEIMKHGIMTTPGLVINGVVKSVGTVPKDSQLLQWLKE